MKLIKDALLLKTIEEIDVEIQERRELIQCMVGTLYPSIVQDEIYQLNMRRREFYDKHYNPKEYER